MQSQLLLAFYIMMMAIGASRLPERVISCGPVVAAYNSSISSVRSGSWSDAATWGGRIPGPNDAPVIAAGNTVILDKDVTIAGMHIVGKLIFDPMRAVAVHSSKNILVTGQLHIQPAKPSIIQTLQFTGIDEANFVGGGMDMLNSDIGLWVMQSGQLQLQGQQKNAWTNAASAISASRPVPPTAAPPGRPAAGVPPPPE